MSISALVSLIIGFGAMFLGYILGGGHLLGLISPTSLIIVIGGTIGAVALSFPPRVLKRLPGILKVAFTSKKGKDMAELIEYFKEVSIKTRKNGLLSIEDTISNDPNIDPFIKKGLQLVVDGVEPQTVRSVLESEAYMTSERHKEGIAVFESAGGYSPTMGIIGTVMHLVEIMGSLEETSTLGPKIGAAFLATLYGIWTANLLYLPIGSRLKVINKNEEQQYEMTIEAIIAIQEGINPNTLVEKLKSYLSADELKNLKNGGEE
ncbi:flagellar motor protein [Clostridium cylindrosporum]|uniref:Motility protein A n=1 Tax=Clostridium cylindrosporum DSM 605 TaxID=1121307 RepID=A0A0J8DGL1_CLOCY|nr:flagellar motor protein [Clostridium cylindrosporum]KMT23364.1 motility protein A [Clostridium cylindrosporum DSM 605]